MRLYSLPSSFSRKTYFLLTCYVILGPLLAMRSCAPQGATLAITKTLPRYDVIDDPKKTDIYSAYTHFEAVHSHLVSLLFRYRAEQGECRSTPVAQRVKVAEVMWAPGRWDRCARKVKLLDSPPAIQPLQRAATALSSTTQEPSRNRSLWQTQLRAI